ncbi:MAG TPA: hypothetical protein VMS31_03340 [Pyrinomonadaceae bacterium]|nr:hypothetical protein [Pyrinomonadaceae bacterium]
MNCLKRYTIRVVPLLAISIGVAIATDRVRSAAELPPGPCEGKALTGASRPGTQLPRNVGSPQKAATRNLAILIFDGAQIIDDTRPCETLGYPYPADGVAFKSNTVSWKGSVRVHPKAGQPNHSLLGVKLGRSNSIARVTSE